MAIPDLTTSKITPASDIAGSSSARRRQRIRQAWSLRAKTALLAVIFVLVPIFLYLEFRAAYDESQGLLLRSVRAQGRAISQSLLPALQAADTGSLPDLNRLLAGFAGEVTTIKLLFAPVGTSVGPTGFYYVASWPQTAPGDLQAERATLEQQGVLARLAQDCRGDMPFSLSYQRPSGGAQFVTAVTPLSTPAGCWAVVASFSAEAFPSAHLGEPYWSTPTVRIAAIIYFAMAAITFSTLLGIRGGLRRFAERARRIRERGADAGSFADRDNLPELADVAAEFDRMVDALNRSAAEIRSTAEDNAHAFKTPIAVIRQSLEPLRRALPEDNARARRAFGVVESSLDRLDGLVLSARRLDEATADLIARPRVPVDLERVIGRLLHRQSAILGDREVTITAELQPGNFVLGSEEMIETVIENLLDNAASFAPEHSDILVRLVRDGNSIDLSVTDSGPGVPPHQLERIFERYYSERRGDAASEVSSTYFGIGLWIARRNVEAMGGTIRAENRTPHGLTIRIRLPPASARV
jgi:two-component system sensor histidine kinase ChvG